MSHRSSLPPPGASPAHAATQQPAPNASPAPSSSSEANSWELVDNASNHSLREKVLVALQEYPEYTLEYKLAETYVRDSLPYNITLDHGAGPPHAPSLAHPAPTSVAPFEPRDHNLATPTFQGTSSHSGPSSSHHPAQAFPNESPHSHTSSSATSENTRSTVSPTPRQPPDSRFYDPKHHELRLPVTHRIPVQPQFPIPSQATAVNDSSPFHPLPPHAIRFPSAASTDVPISKELSPAPSESSLGSFPVFSKHMYVQPDGRIPPGALYFLFGFLLFPTWWIGSYWPRNPSSDIDTIWKRYNRWMAAFSLLLLGAVLGAAIWYAVHDT
ncbi:hypothetical protein H4R34_002959 [Dimargaris verticillata]|uniref:Uncharacterized protein n=1 Tax=Dimargaris verticillata TaxID=2761393 RepID=A0A9W8B1K8_9FUNG|nr:hypothetical protein H4R34_002959 [Dimargaris verticillata]